MPALVRNLSLFANILKPEAVHILSQFIPILKTKRGLIFDIGESFRCPDIEAMDIVINPDEQVRKNCQLAVSIGGDGTLLATTRFFADRGIPLLGINVGHLGFLTEFSFEQALAGLDAILAGNYVTTQRMRLQVLLQRKKSQHSYTVLNDAVISKGGKSRMIEISLFVNDEYFTKYRADGVIFSTPTGSTGYNLSSYGPILHPTSQAIVSTPICPHTFAVRPIILPNGTIIECRVTPSSETQPEKAFLTLDGQIPILLEKNDRIFLKSSAQPAQIICHADHSFYTVLRTKLGWVG